MVKLILLATTMVCAAGWFFAKITVKTLLCFMDEKGYTLPTEQELKACSRKAVEDTFTLSQKNKR